MQEVECALCSEADCSGVEVGVVAGVACHFHAGDCGSCLVPDLHSPELNLRPESSRCSTGTGREGNVRTGGAQKK